MKRGPEESDAGNGEDGGSKGIKLKGSSLPPRRDEAPSRLRKSRYMYAMVCASNINRSIMAHLALQKNDINCNSYGIGEKVRLPGATRESPAEFEFKTPYLEMHKRLSDENPEVYTQNRVLELLERDAKAKCYPERWQDASEAEISQFDVVVCFENRIYDICIEDIQNRTPQEFKSIHIVAMPVKDTPDDAKAAEADVVRLCKMFEETEDLDANAAEVIERFEEGTNRTLMHQIAHV